MATGEDLGRRNLRGYQEASTGGDGTLVAYDFFSGASYTYTATEIEFSGGAKLISQYGSTVLAAASFATSKVLDYSKYSGTLAAFNETGTVNISGGKLNLTSGANAQISFYGYKNCPAGGIGTVKFLHTPNYTGSPASGQFIFQWLENANSTRNYLMIQHWTDGKLTVLVKDGDTNNRFSANTAWSPTSGTEYEIMLSFNTNGTHALYKDGTRVLTTTSLRTYNPFDDMVGRIIMGDNDSLSTTYVANYKLRNLLIYSDQQQTGASYTPGYTMPTAKYLTTNPSFIQTTGVAGSGINQFEASVDVTGSDLVKYIINVGGTDMYWDGAAWTTSDGSYTQSNTEAEVDTNGPTLTAGTYKVKAFLHSANGSTTPTLLGLAIAVG